MSCVLVLLMAIVVVLFVVLLGGSSTPPFVFKWGQDYKEGNRVGYNIIPISSLSLLAYFTYIFIDIIIYTLGSMP
jgi:hypothetical protein